LLVATSVTAPEPLGRKLAQQHRVGNVLDVEFVEAQDPCPFSQCGRNFGQGAAAIAELIESGVDVIHEAMKMRPLDAHAGGLERLDEKIHQQRLAAPHATVDIDSLHGPRAPEPAAGMLKQRILALLQRVGDMHLAVVELQLAGLDQGRVAPGRPVKT